MERASLTDMTPWMSAAPSTPTGACINGSSRPNASSTPFFALRSPALGVRAAAPLAEDALGESAGGSAAACAEAAAAAAAAAAVALRVCFSSAAFDRLAASASALAAASACCADISSGRGKLQRAAGPRIARAAASYARAASSAVSKVPNHLLAPTVGSRISAAHFPHGRCRTPLYVLFLPFETTSTTTFFSSARTFASLRFLGLLPSSSSDSCALEDPSSGTALAAAAAVAA
mmetsp:Transcript_5244/g.11489  ORF Transcript_5244/g.11489 Transcript_5244/m.11489 type:complete len:233 (-) Transcript_5244:565-1263(-)